MKKSCRLLIVLFLSSCMLLLFGCSSNRMNASYVVMNDHFSLLGEVVISDRKLVKELANEFSKLKFKEISIDEWEQNATYFDIEIAFYNKKDIYVGKTECYFVLNNNKVAFFNNKYYMSIGEIDYQRIVDIKNQ